MTEGSPFGRGERDPLYVALAGATSQSSSGGVLFLRRSGELTFQFESSSHVTRGIAEKSRAEKYCPSASLVVTIFPTGPKSPRS